MANGDGIWLSSRASLGEALTAIGIADAGDLELALPSTNGLVLKRNGFIYRFATGKWQARRMEREAALLARIGSQLPVRVPEIVQSSSRPVFHMYKGIAGIGLNEIDLTGQESSWRERTIGSLARFIAELHQCETNWCRSADRIRRARYDNVATTAALDRYDAVNPDGTARRFAAETAERYEASRPKRPSEALLHFDLVPANVLIDTQSGVVVGIIDFTEWMLGDHHWEFWPFRHVFGDDGLRRIVQAYEAEGGRPVDFEFVMAIERIQLCRNLLRAKQPRQALIDRIVGLMTMWRPMA